MMGQLYSMYSRGALRSGGGQQRRQGGTAAFGIRSRVHRCGGSLGFGGEPRAALGVRRQQLHLLEVKGRGGLIGQPAAHSPSGVGRLLVVRVVAREHGGRDNQAPVILGVAQGVVGAHESGNRDREGLAPGIDQGGGHAETGGSFIDWGMEPVGRDAVDGQDHQESAPSINRTSPARR